MKHTIVYLLSGCLGLLISCTRSFAQMNTSQYMSYISSEDSTDLPVIFYLTGDGGLNKISRHIVKSLHQQGYPVAQFNSKIYFRTKKFPEKIAKDISSIIHNNPLFFADKPLLFLGYSFGADILPFALTKMSTKDLSKVKRVIMLSPALFADFKVTLATLLNTSKGDPQYPVVKEAQYLKDSLHKDVLVFFGNKEKTAYIEQYKNAGLPLTIIIGEHGAYKRYKDIIKLMTQLK